MCWLFDWTASQLVEFLYWFLFKRIYHMELKVMLILLCNICGCRETGWRNPTGFLNSYFIVFHILWYRMWFIICGWLHVFGRYWSSWFYVLSTIEIPEWEKEFFQRIFWKSSFSQFRCVMVFNISNYDVQYRPYTYNQQQIINYIIYHNIWKK